MEVIDKDGRYEFRAEIGKGSCGVVLAAMDLRRRLPVVARRFDKSIPTEALAKYAEIAKAIAQSSIAGAVTPYEIVVSGPAPFAVFAAHDGAPLESMLNGGPLQWARAVEIVTSCAETLAAVRATTGAVHGGLKPSNVWITEKGKTLVLDLGTAGLSPPGPVRRGAAFVEYRAPEQLDGAHLDSRADVFALGVLLVELTTGIHPFTGATAFQAAHKLTRTPPDLATVTRGMPTGGAQEVAKFLTRALAGKPEDRHPDAGTFAAALAYLRRTVGAPALPRTQPAAASPSPLPPAPSIEDHTTILCLPGLNELFKKMSAPPLAAAAAPTAPPPAEPGTLEQRLSGAPAQVPARISATERDIHPSDADDATQVLPQLSRKTRLARSGMATVSSLERAPSPAIDDDVTQMLPRSAPGARLANHAIVPTPVHADRTERERRRIDENATRDPPRIAHKSPPVRVVLPPTGSEATLLLPTTGEQTFTGIDSASPATARQASPRVAPGPPSVCLHWFLIGINLCAALALAAVAWVTLR